MSHVSDISKVREKVDGIDDAILSLLTERANCALQIKGLKGNGVTYKPGRESDVVKHVLKNNQGPLPAPALEAIFREIIGACRNLQKPLVASFLGPEGTYSHEAALKFLGNTSVLNPKLSLAEAVKSVENGSADVAVLPIENSTEGAVIETHRLLLKSDLKICAEYTLPISHCLLTKAKKLSNIKAVHAHPQALGQCREWLQLHLPDAELINESSNGQAVMNVKKKSRHAAIASSQAAAIFNVPILVTGISDSASNQTRFIVLGRSSADATGDDKTSILCSVRDKVGALQELLMVLSRHKVNLVRLESQPHADHEYVFYMDVEGHEAETSIKAALKELASVAKTCKLLGSYPKGL